MSILKTYPRNIRNTVITSLILVAIPAVLTIVNFQRRAALWENAHWTLATWCMTYLGYLGWRSASGDVRRIRGIMTLGLLSYTIGQILWDIQWVNTYTGFPAISDIFYLGIAPFLGVGLFLTFQYGISRSDKLALNIDSAIILAGLATIIFALYGPRSSSLPILATVVLVAYPLVFLALGGTALLGALTARSQFRIFESPYALLLGLGLSGICWVIWNSLALDQVIPPGSWVAYGFSLAHLVVGLGVAVWNSVPSTKPRFNLWAKRTLWVMPILIIPLTVVAMEFRTTDSAFLRIPTTIGGFLVVTLVVFRQNLLLVDRDRLLSRERESLQRAERELAERKRAEAALRDSELKFRSIFDNSVDAIGVSKTGIHVMVNPAYLNMFGYESADELAGQSILDLIAPSHRLQILDYIQRRAAGEDIPSLYETRGVHRDGTEFDMEVHVSTFELGGELYTVPILRDITQRKRVDHALRESEARYRRLTETSPDAITLTDLGGIILFCNQQAALLQGFGRAEEMIGRNAFEFVAPENAQLAIENARKTLEMGSVRNVEYVSVKADGTRFLVELSASVILDAKGKPSALIGVVRDITERKQTEEALCASEIRYRAIVESTTDLICRFLPDTTLTFVNEAYCRYFGQSRNQLIGTPFLALIPKDDWEGIQNHMGMVIQNKKPVTYSHQVMTPEGEIRWQQWTDSTMLDEQGEVVELQSVGRDITEQVLTEKSLKESERRFREMLEGVSLAGVMLDTKGRVIFINDFLLHITGWSREDALDKNWFEMFLPPDIRDDVRSAFSQLITITQNVMPHYENEILTTQAERRLIRWSNTLLFDSNGDISGTASIGEDITERKATEKALQESLLRQAAILDNIPDIAWLKDDESRFIAVNEPFGQACGMATADLVGKTDLDIWPKELAEGYRKDDFEVMRSGKRKHIEEHLVDSAGRELLIETIKTPIFDDMGQLMGTAGIARDITERKRMEEALRESEEKHKALIETTNTGYVIIDAQGRVMDANQEYVRLTGHHKRVEILGRSVVEWTAPHDLERNSEEVRKCFERGSVRNLEIDYINREGQITPVEINATVVGASTSTRILTLCRDITERKQIEEEREALIRELEAKNAELERFTYTVSHDLKSPLVTIKGFLGFLKQDLASDNAERLYKDIERIDSATTKMELLLRDLLELSRIGRLMNPAEEIPFEELVHEALEIVHGQLEARGAMVHTQPNLPAVYGDRQRLTEVLQNLLDNASKYMGGQTDPRVEIGQRGEENGKPVFYVRDNGIGIEPEHHERIFGLFNKLDATSEGTGVGLTLVKRIVELHGGRIWVESEPGKGATFYFTLARGKGK